MEIRKITDRDSAGIRALFALCFDKELTPEEWTWKYLNSVWSSKGYVAVHDNMIIAFYGGIKLKFEFKGTELTAYQFCDVMTHPKYRGRLVSKTPLIAMLGEMFYRENPMDFAFGFPSLRHAKLQSIRLGGEGYRLVRLYKKSGLKSHSALWSFRVKEGWEFFNAIDLSRFNTRADGTSLTLIKDVKYIKWRYTENLSREYRLLTFRQFHAIKGYVIFNVEDGWFNILEVFCRKENDFRKILCALEGFIVQGPDTVKGIKAWFHPAEPVTEHLKTLGYKSEDHIPVAFKTVNASCGVTAEVFYGEYHYRMGDYDAG